MIETSFYIIIINLNKRVIFNIIYMCHVFCYMALWYFLLRIYNTQNIQKTKDTFVHIFQ